MLSAGAFPNVRLVVWRIVCIRNEWVGRGDGRLMRYYTI